MLRRKRFVPLTDDLPEDEGFPLHTCNYCDHNGNQTLAVIAVEHESKTHRYYGACAHHAELMPWKLNEWTEY